MSVGCSDAHAYCPALPGHAVTLLKPYRERVGTAPKLRMRAAGLSEGDLPPFGLP
jgi:hypothetical protein